MTWQPAFVGRVLTPDHTYAATHLYQAFLDGLTTHVSTDPRARWPLLRCSQPSRGRRLDP